MRAEARDGRALGSNVRTTAMKKLAHWSAHWVVGALVGNAVGNAVGPDDGVPLGNAVGKEIHYKN